MTQALSRRIEAIHQKNPWVLRGLFVILAWVLYGRTIGFGYINEDLGLINTSFRDIWFGGIHVRPVWYLSYFLTNCFWQSSHFEHAVNITMFGVAGALAFELAHHFLRDRTRAVLAAVVWMFLPWNAFPASWISQRNDLLILCFGYLALLLFHRDRLGAALLCLALAIFAKVTVIALPIYFLYHLYRRKRNGWLSAYAVLFVVNVASAGIAYVLFRDQSVESFAKHASALGKALNYVSHWFEVLIAQFVPVPFFVSYLHAGFCLAALVLLFLALRWQRGRLGPSLVSIYCLVTLTSMVNSELRVVPFASLFLVLVLCGTLTVRWRRLFVPALGCVLIAYAIGAQTVSSNFHSGSYAPDRPADRNKTFYANEFYAQKRVLLHRAYEYFLGRLKLDEREQRVLGAP